MPTDLVEQLQEHFGFESFRPGQEKVIRALLEGRSALAVFPTGAGKSLCYQLSALQIDGLTLVVSPLIALMKDQIDFLKSKGVPAARLDSTMEAAEAISVTDGIQQGRLKLLYVAPERFNNERFVAEMRRARIGLFAIDEAHCISEWGHNFRPDYLKLAETAKDIGAERVLALTATATPAVVEDICRSFDISTEDAVVTGFYRPNLTLFTTPTTPEERDRLLVSRLRERSAGPTIVYVTLQKTAEAVADHLAQHNLPARAYHAGMEAETRHEVQEWWMREPAGIVVATIA
ncbi:MAG: RecQ family ATP-dependent DNA helicase, partial [Fimbriimonadales bacterium]